MGSGFKDIRMRVQRFVGQRSETFFNLFVLLFLVSKQKRKKKKKTVLRPWTKAGSPRECVLVSFEKDLELPIFSGSILRRRMKAN